MSQTHYNQTLYKIHSTGQVGSWQITVDQASCGEVTLTRSALKVLGGKPVITPQIYTEGKNLGRANETTPLMQAVFDAQSKVKKQLDKGYVTEVPKEGDIVTNSLGFAKPMLAQPIEKVKKWDFPVYASPKLDGHRMLATVQDGKVVLYSRQGKVLDVEHIRSELQSLHEIMPTLLESVTLDGEVYAHGETLQTISSWVKKPKPESKKLKYVMYDVISQDPNCYDLRLSFITRVANLVNSEIIDVVPSPYLESEPELDDFHSENLSNGYEGTMVRHGNAGYEEGKRSNSLMKKKDFQDAEFKVTSVKSGTPVIKGEITYQVAVYECITSEGKAFTCTSPGTMQEKHQAWLDRENATGKMLTVKFFNYTPENIPFLPVALRLREDI